MRVAAFFQLADIKFQLLNFRRFLNIRYCSYFELFTEFYGGYVFVIKIYYLFRIFHDRACIRCYEHLVVANTHYQWASFSCCNDDIGIFAVYDCYGVCSHNLVEYELHGTCEVHMAGEHDVFYHLYEDFGVRL